LVFWEKFGKHQENYPKISKSSKKMDFFGKQIAMKRCQTQVKQLLAK